MTRPPDTPDPLDSLAPLDRLRTGRRVVHHVTSRRSQDIRAALAAGHTWADIAEALDDTELGVLLDHHQAVSLPDERAEAVHP